MLVLILILLSTCLPLTPSVAGRYYGKSPQGIFNINVTVTVYTDLSASISLSVKLVNKGYIKALSNERDGKKEFRTMVLQLIYENLAMDLKDRGGKAILRGFQTLPNWSASVIVYVPRFLTVKNGTLRCPYSGPLNFVYENRVLGYAWNKFTLIMPPNMTGVFVFPKPAHASTNVFIWRDGDFIPMIQVTLPSFTPASIVLTREGNLTEFRATFTGTFNNSTVRVIEKKFERHGASNLSHVLRDNGKVLVIKGLIRSDESLPYNFKNVTTSTASGPRKGNVKGHAPLITCCIVAVIVALVFILRRR